MTFLDDHFLVLGFFPPCFVFGSRVNPDLIFLLAGFRGPVHPMVDIMVDTMYMYITYIYMHIYIYIYNKIDLN